MRYLYGCVHKIRLYESIACKHKDLKMAEVPKDYLQWLSSIDLEEDLEYTVLHYLGGSTHVKLFLIPWLAVSQMAIS